MTTPHNSTREAFSSIDGISTPAGKASMDLPPVPAYYSARARLNPPRKAGRIYTESELRTAADMLDRLRCGHEKVPIEYLDGVPSHDANRVFDIVADRILASM